MLMHPLKEQAVATLKEEELSWERASFIFMNGTCYFIAESDREGKPANKEKLINKVHKLIKKTCLERFDGELITAPTQTLYEFSV